jgi:hypothetical protein
MLALALEGITSLSVTPLRIIAMTGFITCIISTIAAIYALIQKTTGTTGASIFLIGYFDSPAILSSRLYCTSIEGYPTSCIISTIAAIYALIQKTTGTTVEGWTSVMIAL